MRLHGLIAIAAAAGAAGCAGPYEREAAFAAGWRVARVVEVGPADGLGHRVSHDCRSAGLPERTPEATFATLRYEGGSRFHRLGIEAVAPAPADLRAGDLVYVNINDCGAALVPRSTSLSAGPAS